MKRWNIGLVTVFAMGMAGTADAALVGHYTFDDNTNAAAGDGTPALTLHGNAALADGGLVLDGAGDYAVANSSFIDGATGVTMTAWFVANAAITQAIAQMPIDGGNGTSQSAVSLETVVIAQTAPAPNILGIQGGGRSGTGNADSFQSGILSSHDIALGSTYFAATVLDYVEKTVSMYLYDLANDTWYSNTTGNRLFGSDMVAGETLLNIGRRGDGQRYFNGTINELRIYDTALSESEVLAVVPEPASLAVLTAGSVLGLARRRR